jgi:hypothetical protein
MELDLFIPTLGIAIEPGNWFWHKDKIERDTRKRQLCKEHGIRLITIFDGFYGDPKMFASDFYYTSGSLNEKENYKVLKDIIYRILPPSGLSALIVSTKVVADKCAANDKNPQPPKRLGICL